MANALYMMPGGNTGGLWGPRPTPPVPPVNDPGSSWGRPNPPAVRPTPPIRPGNEGGGLTAPAPSAPPPNVLGPEAIRASGPSQGFDPSYLQNLATAIGGIFSNQKQGGNVMNVNPLGNLGEISPNSSMEGNAPNPGLPQTWLQQALNGGGFAYSPAVAPKPKPKPAQGTNVVNNPYGPGGRPFNPRLVNQA